MKGTSVLVGVTTCSLVLSLVAGCGAKVPQARLKPIPQDAVILVYAAGVGGDEVDIFRSAPMEDTLAKEMKRKVVCMGQPGEFAESALRRLPDVLKSCDPDLMVLGYGAMDLWKQTDREKLKANLIAWSIWRGSRTPRWSCLRCRTSTG